MRLIYLFPGQGSQHLGMGRKLFDRFPEAVARADEQLGYSVRSLCLEDPDRRLGNTRYTQPALYVVNALSYFEKLEEAGRTPDFVAGHSLGEFSALLAAEVLDFETGLALVAKRGQLMSRVEGGGMAAVIGLEGEKVRQLLYEFAFDTLDIANYNAPDQTVVSGPKRDIEALSALFEEIEELKGSRYVQLNVSGAFHSRYMKEVEVEFSRFLKQFQLGPPKIPVVSNFLARPYDSSNIHATLASQISNPVRWSESMQYLLSQDDPTFEEVGPGRTLTGLLHLNRATAAA